MDEPMERSSMSRTAAGMMMAVMIAASVLVGFPAYSADDAVTRAMKLYEKRHYDEAISVLRADGVSIEPGKQGAANLALGMAYFRNAVLHRELYQASAQATLDYLKKLSAFQGKDRSRFVDLYFGETLIETGKAGAAAIYLEKFSGSDGVEPRYRTIAQVGLGLCYHQSGDAPKAAALWDSLDAADAEVKAELAAAYSRADVTGKAPLSLLEAAVTTAKQSGKPLSMRMLKNALAVYTRAGMTDKGLELLKRADLKAPSYRETMGKSKVISFYDLSLLGDMASLYGQACIAYLEKAVGDAKLRDAAEFTLAQAYSLFGSADQALKLTTSFPATSQMPQQYKDRIRVWQGSNLYLKNRQTEAMNLWEGFARKQPEDPELLAEVVFACGRAKAECQSIVQRSATVAEAGEGRKMMNLNIALGRYYLLHLDLARAIAYLEAGRDKSNKNKIESNDPVMLAGLADAYHRTKKFSEALEIYFEMSKYVPEVRQIQEAMQGVYAMEHKSAGDVKIN